MRARKGICAPRFLEFEELIELWKRLWGSSNFTDKKNGDSERPATFLRRAGVKAGEPAPPKEGAMAPSLHITLVLIWVPPQPLVVPPAKPGSQSLPCQSRRIVRGHIDQKNRNYGRGKPWELQVTDGSEHPGNYLSVEGGAGGPCWARLWRSGQGRVAGASAGRHPCHPVPGSFPSFCHLPFPSSTGGSRFPHRVA